jgi:tRNA pseudouridine38-40 synthase
VGQGRRDPAWVEEVLAARDRRSGSVVAPAHGLTLWRVGFAGDRLDDW